MPTQLQLQANRANARRSTGPRSRAGKWRSAHNAHRHGLSLPVWADPALSAEAEALALELAGPAASLELQQSARIAALAHIDVDRVRRTRHSLIRQELADPVLMPTTARAAMKLAKDLIRFDELSSQGRYIPWQLRSVVRIPDDANKLSVVFANLAEQLTVLERYERRALSRRKWAFRRFVTVQRQCKAATDSREQNIGDNNDRSEPRE
jgi:hypothetical protein